MKLIYAQGFSKNERLEWRPVIFNNVVQSFRTINEAMNEIGIDYQNPDNEVSPRAVYRVHRLCISQTPRVQRLPAARRGAAGRDISSAAANYLSTEIHGAYSRRV